MDIGLVIIAIIGGGLTLLFFRAIDGFSSTGRTDEDDKIEVWTDILNENTEISKDERLEITEVFIPFSISPKKYFQCAAYFYDEFDVDSYVPDSLVKFKKDPSSRIPGYPDWFYHAFPDVAWWVIHGFGNVVIKSMYIHLPTEEYMEGGVMKRKYIIEIIKTYKIKTSQKLSISLPEIS